MAITSWRTLLALLVTLATLAWCAAAGPAGAAPELSVAVYPTSPFFAPGSDALLIVRAEGDEPDLATLEFTVEGGVISAVLSLNLVSPRVAEGVVFIRRDSPGEATLTVFRDGAIMARGTAVFGASGRITVSASVDAGSGAAGRTWRFEVVDAAGTVADTLSLSTSGDAPTGSAQSAALPLGRYTVRQILGSDTGLACSRGAFYEVTAPAGAATMVDLAASEVAVQFAIRLCPGTPALEVSRPVDEGVPDPGVIDDVRGTRTPATPLPPATGSGLQQTPSRGATIALVLLACAAGAGAMSLARHRGRPRSSRG